MLRADGRIVKTSRDRVRGRNLSGLILQHIRIGPLQHARRTSTETRGVFTQAFAPPARLHPDELHFLVFDKFVKDADGIRPATDTSNDRLGKFSFSPKDLRPRLAPGDLV